MFLRSKVQEMILRRRSRSMNSAGAGGALAGQHATSSAAAPCDGGNGGAGKRALFGSPRLLHCASLPSGGGGGGGAEPEAPYSMSSPTSVLDAAAAAAFAPSPDVAAGGKRRPWCDGGAGTHGLADALDSTDDGVVLAQQKPLLRSCSLDRRVEFGVKNKSSWLPLRSAAAGGGESSLPATAAASPEMEMEPSSEDYTCVISRGPNPKTVHIFGDRVVEGLAGESSPRPINLPAPAREARGFLSL